MGSRAVTGSVFPIGHVGDWRPTVPGAESQTGEGEGTGKGYYQEGRSGADNDRDGDLTSSSRAELERTHGQCGRGPYCPNQLICAFSDLPTGFISIKIWPFFFSVLSSCVGE